MTNIILNSIGCKKCGDIIISESVQDIVLCKCESCGAGGGKKELIRTGDKEDWVELSVTMEES